jgi:hypothetical protein
MDSQIGTHRGHFKAINTVKGKDTVLGEEQGLVTVVHHCSDVPGWLILRACPCPTSSLFVMRRREDKGGPIQLPFPIAKPHDWFERGVEVGKKE